MQAFANILLNGKHHLAQMIIFQDFQKLIIPGTCQVIK